MKTMKPKITFILILLLSINIYAQNKLFDKGRLKTTREVYLIDSANVERLDSTQFTMSDSINVIARKFTEKISTQNSLNKSSTKFQINYYFKTGKLFFIKVEEQSPKFRDLKKHIEYYILNDKISDVNYYYNGRICLPLSLDTNINDQFGYNKRLTEKFMKKYVFKLYKKLEKNFR